jgi:hypothetical protein
MKIKENTPIKLKTFLGTTVSPDEVNKSDDYWKLIGQSGIVIDDNLADKGRVLVLFSKNLNDFQLANHNPIKNSLMIKKSDLEIDKYGIYQQKLDKAISQRSSFMNNSKWFKLFNQLKGQKLFFNRGQIKFLISDIESRFAFDESEIGDYDENGFGDIVSGPFKFKEIEWLSIHRTSEVERRNREEVLTPNIITQPIDEIEEALKSLGEFEYDINEFELKIFGYK